MSAVTSRSGAVAVLLPPFGIGGSIRRIRALVLRYMYLLRSSGIRLLELISKDIVGAGVVAGGPFACAEISLEEARRRIAYGLGGLVVGWQTICPRCVHTLSSSHGFRPSHRSQSSAVGNDWMRSCIVATRCAVCRLANLAACRSRHRRTRSASVIARSPIGFRPMSSSFP
jgi:hypothetical protein